jgi:hypothetical protein
MVNLMTLRVVVDVLKGKTWKSPSTNIVYAMIQMTSAPSPPLWIIVNQVMMMSMTPTIPAMKTMVIPAAMSMTKVL